MAHNISHHGAAQRTDGRPVRRQLRGTPSSIFRPRHRIGVVITAVTLAVVSLPAMTQAWSATPVTAEVSTTSSYGVAVTADNNGNTFQSVYYTGSISFGSHTVNAASPTASAQAVVKFNSEGVAQWVANTGVSDIDINGMATDNNGNLFISGSMSNTVSLGSTTLTSAGGSDGFVAKLSSSGAWIWAKSVGGSGSDWASGVDTDSAGNVFMSGGFQSSMTIGLTVLTSAGSNDLYITKLDSSGNFLWANKVGGSGDDNAGWLSNLAVDSAGNSFVTGQMSDSLTINGTTLTSAGGRDLFIAKFDSSGAIIWGVRAGSASSDNLFGVALDSQGNAFITGFVRGPATFGSIALTQDGYRDGFIAKINSAGVWQWAVGFGSVNEDEQTYAVTLDREGNPVVVGDFIDPFTIGGTTLTSSGGTDGFVAKWNSSGTFQWAQSAGGSNYDGFYGVGTSSDGNLFVSGYFHGPETVNFGGGSSTIAPVVDVNVFWGLSSSGGPATTTTSTTSTSTTTVAPTTTTTVAPTTTTTVAPTTTTTVAPPAVAVVVALPLAKTPLVADKPLSAGGEVSVTFSGFVPGEFVQLIVASTPRVIGSGYADSKGIVTLTGKMPASLASGNHTLAVYASVSGIGFKQAVAVVRMTVATKKFYTARTLAKRVGVKVVSPKAKVTMTVRSSSKKNCAIVAAKLKTLKAGSCVVTFTVQEPKPAKGKQLKATKTVKALVIQKG